MKAVIIVATNIVGLFFVPLFMTIRLATAVWRAPVTFSTQSIWASWWEDLFG